MSENLSEDKIQEILGPLTDRTCRTCGDRLYLSDDILCGPCSAGWQ